MRQLTYALVLSAVMAGTFGCGGETRTIVRRETTTQTVPADPVVIEKRTIIQPPEERVYEETERRTVIEHDD